MFYGCCECFFLSDIAFVNNLLFMLIPVVISHSVNNQTLILCFLFPPLSQYLNESRVFSSLSYSVRDYPSLNFILCRYTTLGKYANTNPSMFSFLPLSQVFMGRACILFSFIPFSNYIHFRIPRYTRLTRYENINNFINSFTIAVSFLMGRACIFFSEIVFLKNLIISSLWLLSFQYQYHFAILIQFSLQLFSIQFNHF